MSLLSDLIAGKQITLSDASKATITYKADANVLSVSINGILSVDDVSNLMRIFGLLRAAKDLESKV